MQSVSRAELIDRYTRVTTKIAEVRKQRSEFVQQKTQELSEAHDDISGSFSTSSLRELGGKHPFVPSDDSARQRVVLSSRDKLDETRFFDAPQRELPKRRIKHIRFARP